MSKTVDRFSEIFQKTEISGFFGMLFEIKRHFNRGGFEEYIELQKKSDCMFPDLKTGGTPISRTILPEDIKKTLELMKLVEDMTDTEFSEASEIANNDPYLKEYREYVCKGGKTI